MTGRERLERALGLPVSLTLVHHTRTRAVWSGADLVVRVCEVGRGYTYEVTGRDGAKWSGTIRPNPWTTGLGGIGLGGLRRALRTLLSATDRPPGLPEMTLPPA